MGFFVLDGLRRFIEFVVLGVGGGCFGSWSFCSFFVRGFIV